MVQQAQTDVDESPQDAEELFQPGEAESLEAEWREAQLHFVDEPRRAVEEASELVARTLKALEANFQASRLMLEREWQEGGEPTTENLRRVVLSYKSFFRRLLSA